MFNSIRPGGKTYCDAETATFWTPDDAINVQAVSPIKRTAKEARPIRRWFIYEQQEGISCALHRNSGHARLGDWKSRDRDSARRASICVRRISHGGARTGWESLGVGQ